MRDFNTALPCVHCDFTWGEVERKYLFSQDSKESHYKPVQTFWRLHVLKRKEKTHGWSPRELFLLSACIRGLVIKFWRKCSVRRSPILPRYISILDLSGGCMQQTSCMTCSSLYCHILYRPSGEELRLAEAGIARLSHVPVRGVWMGLGLEEGVHANRYSTDNSDLGVGRKYTCIHIYTHTYA